jgi:GABA permease
VSPDRVFSFLLNSSGAIILFVYLLIAVSQLLLRRRTPPERMRVRMWFYPVLTLATIAAMLGVLASMFVRADTRSQLLLSLLSWAVVLALYAVTRWRGGSVDVAEMEPAAAQGQATRVLVLANETLGAEELLDELRSVDAEGRASYFVCVPANPVDTGQAEVKGAVWVWQATVDAARSRLDSTLEILRSHGLEATGDLGDYRPLHALRDGVARFHPDRIVIATHPEGRSTWLRHGVVDTARKEYDVPVRHVIATAPAGARA